MYFQISCVADILKKYQSDKPDITGANREQLLQKYGLTCHINLCLVYILDGRPAKGIPTFFIVMMSFKNRFLSMCNFACNSGAAGERGPNNTQCHFQYCAIDLLLKEYNNTLNYGSFVIIAAIVKSCVMFEKKQYAETFNTSQRNRIQCIGMKGKEKIHFGVIFGNALLK